MYTLYYSQGACSVATQVVLHELGQDVKIIDKHHVDDFKAINPVAEVPVLVDGKNILREGAAIMLHLLSKHPGPMLAESGNARIKAIEDIMFANSTMHPAYGKLFFLTQNVTDEYAKQVALNSAAETINNLWRVVESELEHEEYLGGNRPSAADIMLAVYSNWGKYFPVNIKFGEKTTKMLNAVQAMPSYRRAVDAEQAASAQ